jgi:Na+-translocating ferredoxin:NAD+ oxidoreductase RnfD subunit
MRNPIGPFIYSTLLLITFILIANYAFGGEKSKWLNDNPCMIKIVTTQKCLDSQCLITQTTKEEVLKCQDGYDGPSYWELFAQFYYADLTVPAYCREVARADHPFKTPGLICLSEDGDWKEK